jgi:hypothetical protein
MRWISSTPLTVRDLRAGPIRALCALAYRGVGGHREDDAGSGRRGGDPHAACLKRWPASIVELTGLTSTEGVDLLDRWLAEAERTLRPDQRRQILDNFAGTPLPLYLKLAVEHARHWSSWDTVSGAASDTLPLQDTIHGVIADLFDRLEQSRHHGVLCDRALGYLAASRHGLSEAELVEVLSADRRVMSDFVARSPTERVKPVEERLHHLPHRLVAALLGSRAVPFDKDGERCLGRVLLSP